MRDANSGGQLASPIAGGHLTIEVFKESKDLVRVIGGYMGRETEILVIGGGPAGLAAALAARKKGFEVTVADGAKPPIDKACGEGLMPTTIAALCELGIPIYPSDGWAFRGL